MENEIWLQDLYRLLARFSHLGISSDIAAMGLCELWGAVLASDWDMPVLQVGINNGFGKAGAVVDNHEDVL